MQNEARFNSAESRGGRDAKHLKRTTDSGGEPERITYERWFALAVGQLGLSPEEFNAMTPAEFIYAWFGWSELEQSRMRQAWERERWAVWITTCLQLDKKDRLPMTQMFPLPWESEAHTKPQELTMQERRKRINLILQKE